MIFWWFKCVEGCVQRFMLAQKFIIRILAKMDFSVRTTNEIRLKILGKVSHGNLSYVFCEYELHNLPNTAVRILVKST